MLLNISRGIARDLSKTTETPAKSSTLNLVYDKFDVQTFFMFRINYISWIQVSDNYIWVSLHVILLYTNIPRDFTIQILQKSWTMKRYIQDNYFRLKIHFITRHMALETVCTLYRVFQICCQSGKIFCFYAR